MNSQKKYGLRYERTRKKMLEAEGWTMMRSRGSFGAFDLIGCHTDKGWLLESVKSTKIGKYSAKKEIEKITNFNNAPVGTIKRLVLFSKGKMKILYVGIIQEEGVS